MIYMSWDEVDEHLKLCGKIELVVPIKDIPAILAPNADFICEKLAEWFDPPCNWSFEGIGAIDDFMYEHCGDWCNRACSKDDAAACWKKLFEVMANEKDNERI